MERPTAVHASPSRPSVEYLLRVARRRAGPKTFCVRAFPPPLQRNIGGGFVEPLQGLPDQHGSAGTPLVASKPRTRCFSFGDILAGASSSLDSSRFSGAGTPAEQRRP